MKSTIFAVGALLLATVSAQPHGHHQRRHEKHAAAKRDVAWVTDYVDVVETIQLTATVWVDENGNTVSPVVTGTFTATGGQSTSVHAGIFNEPQSTTSTEISTSTTEAPVPTSTTTVQVSQVSTSSESVAPVVATSVAAAPVVAAESSTTSAAAAATTTAATTGSTSGSCSSGSPCNGDLTYYEAGLGACGTTNNGETDLVVALPHEFMGTQSNGNPYCGKSLTISKGGKTVVATVADKCMGCVGRDLDLSNAAFTALGIDFAVGRTTADWWFN
jgi:hypothetical protein